MSRPSRCTTCRGASRSRGFASIEFVLTVALVGFIAGLMVGTVRRTTLWCKQLNTRAVEVREEVWGVGLLQKGHEPRVWQKSDLQTELDHGGWWLERAGLSGSPMPESLADIRLDPKESETLIRCRLKGAKSLWVVGGLQGTRRWRP
jgi:hypothetical protein